MTNANSEATDKRVQRRIDMAWRVTMAASALNISRAEYAGKWDLLTLDQARAVEARLKRLVDETTENLATLEATRVALLTMISFDYDGDE